MTIIIDASVALKWVLEEDDSDSALALLRDHALAAPDLLFVESANVLWVKSRRGQIAVSDARAGLAAIESAPIRTIPTRALAAAAQAIAIELDQTAYDCVYLAAALAEHAKLVTADAAFAEAAASHPVYCGAIALLGAPVN